jgi:poly-gamma-glutamate system protein
LHAARDAVVTEEERAELLEVDPARTGLVGVTWSALQSTPGNLEAKQLSADPRWAALFARWYTRAGLVEGQSVGIAASGSFPALLLSARAAAEELRLEPVVVASLTASNHGATVESFDLWDIEQSLLDAGLLRVPVALWTPGGGNDRADFLEGGDRAFVLRRLDEIAAQGAPIIVPRGPAHSIDLRDELLRDTPLLVNIGGNASNYGSGEEALAFPRGLTMAPDGAALVAPGGALGRGDSAAHRALRAGKPVLHVLAIKPLAQAEGLGPATRVEDFFAAPTPLSRAIALLAAAGLVAATLSPSTRQRLPRPYTPPQDALA